MFPIPHLSWAFSAVVSFLISLKLYKSFLKTKSEKISDFFRLFLFLGMFLFFVFFPAVLSNPWSVQVSYMLAWTFLFLPSFYGLKVLFNIYNQNKLKKFCIPVSLGLATSFLILNLLFFSPAKLKYLDRYWYWSEGTPLWLQFSGGGIISLTTLLLGVFFFIKGLKSKEKFLVTRSLLLGFGFVILFFANSFGYVLFPISSYFVVLAGLLGLVGMVSLYFGIIYKEKIG